MPSSSVPSRLSFCIKQSKGSMAPSHGGRANSHVQICSGKDEPCSPDCKGLQEGWKECPLTVHILRSALSPCLQQSPARPVTRPAGARSGSRHGPCAGPASPWAPASGTPLGDTRVGGCSGPSRARSPRRCRPTCCGRWATQVGVGAGQASSLSSTRS